MNMYEETTRVVRELIRTRQPLNLIKDVYPVLEKMDLPRKVDHKTTAEDYFNSLVLYGCLGYDSVTQTYVPWSSKYQFQGFAHFV